MVLTWGRGVFGQLGHGDTENYSLPTPVEGLIKIQIAQVCCGWQHTLALSTQGKVFSWGYGEDGQLGHGDTSDNPLPREIVSFKHTRIASIAAGHSHSGAISESAPSQLFLWGANPDYRLMTEDKDNRFFPSLTLLDRFRERRKKEDASDPDGE